MLDLQKLNSNLYKIKDADGEILTIKKPSQKLLNQMMEVADEDMNDSKVVDEIYSVLLAIFNSNTQGKTFTSEDVETFDIEIVGMILQDYFEWIGDELGE